VGLALAESECAATARRTSPKIHNANVAVRMRAIDQTMRQRATPFARRSEIQRERFRLHPAKNLPKNGSALDSCVD
ncbi:hypothetical protein, partial [Bradyrhizobium ottawaense]|uniref:hypothetical protein n=1 Tax=Bradyrhizobium ottawaense TaxID=931866 RepID=UPI0030C77B44